MCLHIPALSLMKKTLLSVFIIFSYLAYCLYVYLISQPKEIANCNLIYKQAQQKAVSESTEGSMKLVFYDCDNIKRSFLEILSQKPIQRGFQ